MKTVIQIEGMACGMCEAHINDVIRKIPGVQKVKSSYKKKTSIVISKEPLDEESLRKAIDQTGYHFVSMTQE